MSSTSPLLPRTKLAILRLLLRGDATTAELTSATGLHPTVVRRHLRELNLAGLTDSQPIATPRGRPLIRYRITLSGREVFYARYDVVLDILARTLASRERGPTAVEIFQEAGRNLARGSGAPKPIREVVEQFQEIGFEPELKRIGGRRVLLSHNCPILRVAKKYPELTCDAFHCTLLGEMLGTAPLPLRQAISRGAEYCVHELEVPA